MGCDHKAAIRTFAHAFAVACDGGIRLEVDIDMLCGECMAAVVHRYRSTCSCSIVTGIQLATGDAPICGRCRSAYSRVAELAPRR